MKQAYIFHGFVRKVNPNKAFRVLNLCLKLICMLITSLLFCVDPMNVFLAVSMSKIYRKIVRFRCSSALAVFGIAQMSAILFSLLQSYILL